MPTPIRRSPQLAPLSRDHHQGLLAAWKIKQGLKNGACHKLIAKYIAWFWENELKPHFKKEEQVLAIHLPAGDTRVLRMFSDHEAIEALIHVTAMIQDEDIFLQLADALQAHIRFEERELFPFAETHLPPEISDAIQPILEAKTSSKEWTDEFWIKLR